MFVQANGVIVILQYFPWACECALPSTLLCLTSFLVFSALRSYALSKNKLVSLLVLCLSLVTPSINFVSSPRYRASHHFVLKLFSNQARYAFGVTGGIYDLSPVIPETCLPVDYLTSAMELQYVDSTKLCPNAGC